MPDVTYQTDQGPKTISFSAMPSSQDIEEVAQKQGWKAAGQTSGATSAPAPAPVAPTTDNPQYSTSTMDSGDAKGLPALNTAAKFLGVQKLGAGIATAGRVASGSINQTGNEAAQGLQDTTKLIGQLHQMIMTHVPANDPKRVQLANFLRQMQGQQPVTQDQIDPGTQLSNKEVAGSAGNTALNIAGSGEMTGSGVADDALMGGGKFLNQATEGINSVVAPLNAESRLGRIGNAAVKGAEFGAAQGVTQGMNNNQSNSDIAKSAGTTSLLSSILGGGVQGTAELAKYLTSPAISESLYNRAIGIDKKTAMADRSPAASMIQQGKVGTASGLMTDAQKTIDDTNGQIKQVLAKDTTQHDTTSLIQQMKAQLTKQYGDTLGPEGVQQLMDTLPIAKLKSNPALSTAELNNLRQKIDGDFIGNGKWLSANQDPVKISSYKTAANVLRQTVQGQDTRLPGLYDTLSQSITARNALDSQLAKPHALAHMLELMTGLGAGGTAMLHGDPKAAVAALGAAGMFHAANSTLGQTAAAVGLNKTNQALTNPGAKSTAVQTIARLLGRRAVASASSTKTQPGQPTK